MAQKIRTLLVGCGRMGRNHLRALRENPRFEVVGVVDPKTSLGSGICHYRTLEDAPKCDAAIVATPADVRTGPIEFFCTRNVRVLVEKPLALSGSTALRYAYDSWYLSIGHIERFNPAITELRKVLANGLLGKIKSVDTVRIGGEAPIDAPDVIFDLAVHDIDICRWLFGPLRFEGVARRASWTGIALRTPDGADVSVRVGRGGMKRRTLRIADDCGRVLEVDYQDQLLTNGALLDYPIEKAEPLKLELDAFADFVETGVRSEALCSPTDAIAAVCLCEQATTGHGFV